MAAGAHETSERLHALDAVRGFALLAGIVFHATVSFLPAPNGVPVWIVMDSQRSVALALVFHVTHIFRMTTFFFVAGYFAHLMLERRGAGAFVRNRLKRIALPLVAAWPIVFPSIVAVTIWGALTMQKHGFKLPPPPPYRFPAFPLTHLWFLYMLLLLYAGALAVRALVRFADRKQVFRRVIDRSIHALARNLLLAPVLALPVTAALFWTPGWLAWFGIPTPDSSFLPNAAAATAFGVAFAAGLAAQRQRDLLLIWQQQWPVHLLWALLATCAGLALEGVVPVFLPTSDLPAKFILAASYALASWCWTFAIVGFALRFLSGESRARRYVADASYWFYLAHLPIVMALQVAVSQLAWPWPAKFALILGVTFAVLFASYALFVRNSFIGAVLNGKRMDRAAVANKLVVHPA